MPYYMNYDNISNNENSLDFTRKPEFTIESVNQSGSIVMLPSNSLSLIIALLTNISLFYILKPYVLINTIYMITIPLFQI